jgi:hypothetical protein
MLASVGLVGIQQAVPGPLTVSLLLTVVAALAGRWAVGVLAR